MPRKPSRSPGEMKPDRYPFIPFEASGSQSETIWETFADGFLSGYGGDTGDFSVVQSNVYNGDDSCRLETTNQNETHELFDGLADGPGRGTTFDWQYRLGDKFENLVGFHFGMDDGEDDYYSSIVDTADGELHIAKATGGGSLSAVETDTFERSGNTENNTWTRVRVIFGDTDYLDSSDDIVVKYFGTFNDELASVKISDSDINGDGIGWYSHPTGSDEPFVDYVRS